MKLFKIIFPAVFLIIWSCKDTIEALITVTATDFTVTIDENLAIGQSLGTLSATSSGGFASFSLTSESPAGAFSVNPVSGELTVADASLFDFETNPVLTGTFTATNGAASDVANITVNLNDIDENVTATDFTATILENPSIGQSLGTLVATSPSGSISFSLTTESPSGAFSVNSSTGELTVADASLFNFDTNPVLTGTFTATNGETSDVANITVNLNNVTIWTGTKITFTKADFADHTMAANQDRITDAVWITRADIRGIFNIFTENTYTKNSSPADTEWSFGTSAQISSLTFQSWETAVSSNPPSMVDQDMVVHLISDDIYIDIKFMTWKQGSGGGGSTGGGFSYERSTE